MRSWRKVAARLLAAAPLAPMPAPGAGGAAARSPRARYAKNAVLSVRSAAAIRQRASGLRRG